MKNPSLEAFDKFIEEAEKTTKALNDLEDALDDRILKAIEKIGVSDSYSEESELEDDPMFPMIHKEIPYGLEKVFSDPEHIKALNDLICNHEPYPLACTLVTPAKVVVQLQDETYRTKHLIGGERLFFNSVKAGKRGPILVFTPTSPDTYNTAEIPLSAAEHLFDKELVKYLARQAAKVKIPKKEVLSGMPDVLDEERVKKYDEFGSW